MYQATMRFTIGVSPESDSERVTRDPLYSAYLASEYIADDFAEILRSESFANDVSARLAAEGIAVSAGAIQGFTVAERYLTYSSHGDGFSFQTLLSVEIV